jgi:hypothetical protein
MTTHNTDVANADQRELTIDELDNASAGLLPALVLAFAVGFDIGFIGMCAFGPTGFKG